MICAFIHYETPFVLVLFALETSHRILGAEAGDACLWRQARPDLISRYLHPSPPCLVSTST